jgi:hypothetical protein
MITQERFVTACQRYYARNGLEPGNPLHGVWHLAHYPTPKCLGGTEVVWLLVHHHALHGVVQSEEVSHCCVFTWEPDYLPPRYKAIHAKWRSWLGRMAGLRSAAAHTAEELSEKMKRAGRARAAAITQEDLSRFLAGSEDWRNAHPEEVAQNAQAARDALHEKWQAMTHEEKAAHMKSGAHALYRCTVTGKVTIPGALTLWQRKRGIDPTNRERVT